MSEIKDGEGEWEMAEDRRNGWSVREGRGIDGNNGKGRKQVEWDGQALVSRSLGRAVVAALLSTRVSLMASALCPSSRTGFELGCT